MTSVETDYEARLAARRASLAECEQRHIRLGWLRFGTICLAIALFLVLDVGGIQWIAGLAGLFVMLTLIHTRVLDARDRAKRAVQWYEHGLERIRHQWIGRGDGGERFRPPDHLYCEDLDIIGRGSLFELLSTTRTRAGQETLAAWLLAPAASDVALGRQAAVQELASRPDLREKMSVIGEGVRVEAAALRSWATAPVALRQRWIAFPLAIVSAIDIVLLFYYLFTGDLMLPSMIAMAVLGLVALSLHTRVASVIRKVEMPTRDLAVLAGLLRVLERETFTSPALQRLTGKVRRVGRPASSDITHLEQLVAMLMSRRNMYFAIPAALMMWATQCALAIDGWRRRVGPHVPDWLDAVGEFEALAALGTFAAEHPGYTYPSFTPGPANLDATGLAHPLLDATAIANDIALGGAAPTLVVVSGSNMSGKSTFLRTIGINVVLAFAGAPVRASRLALSPLALGSSIHILDSLEAGHSKFFAEITRLKKIVDLSRSHKDATLFLLDEILAGTNSHDRAHGAAAIIDGLAREGAIGLVTTHDLALSAIADARAPKATNAHFADRFDGGGLAFDYHLRPGPVRTSNALALMRAIGLEVE